jgi:hypothetical protein
MDKQYAQRHRTVNDDSSNPDDDVQVANLIKRKKRTKFIDDIAHSEKDDDDDDANEEDISEYEDFTCNEKKSQKSSKRLMVQNLSSETSKSSNYNKLMDSLDENSITNLNMIHIQISDETVPVPEEYAELLKSLDAHNVEYLNLWLRHEFCKEPKTKRVSAEDAKKARDLNVQMYKEEIEKDINSYLRKNSNSTENFNDIIKKRLMQVHFKLAFILHVGKILPNSDNVKAFFLSNKAKEKFVLLKTNKKGIYIKHLQILTLYTD